MDWAHTYNIEHAERCPDCGKKLDLRFVGKEDWIFYCHECTKHVITSQFKTSEREDRT